MNINVCPKCILDHGANSLTKQNLSTTLNWLDFHARPQNERPCTDEDFLASTLLTFIFKINIHLFSEREQISETVTISRKSNVCPQVKPFPPVI